MDNQTRYREALARYVIVAATLVLIFYICRYFSNVLAYIALAAVVSLLARPVMGLLRKITIRKKSAPSWLLAIVSLILLLAVLGGMISGLVPVMKKVVGEVGTLSSDGGMGAISVYLASFNDFLRTSFSLTPDFRIETVLTDQLKSLFSINLFGNVIGSFASTVASIFVGLFSVVFIAFFFIKDDKLFTRIILALAPDRLEAKVEDALQDVEHLLSRYFVGLVVEMGCVGLIDFLGIWAIARLDFESALGIGFLAGLLNIIPYIGPVIGGVVGSVMCIILKYCGSASVGLDVSFWVFVIILVCIFVAAQMVDNFVLQPLIYSTSIKASPLEIFIVMLLAGTLGGIVGMVVAIPCYTVCRVVALRFFPDVKFIRYLVRK